MDLSNSAGESPPTVSVVIPTYSRSWGLRRAVESVLAQHFTDFELIISDDASTDDTEAVARSFSDPRIRYFRQPVNVGVARNWGAGVARARGEFVSLLMDDDRYEPSFVEQRVRVLREHPTAAFVFSGYRVENLAGETVKEHRPPLPPNALLEGSSVLAAALGRHPFIGTTLYRTRALRAVWPSAERAGIVVDYAANIRLAVAPGAQAFYLNDLDFVMADHPAQLSHTRLGEAYAATAQTVDELLAEPLPATSRRLIRHELSSWHVSWGRWTAQQHQRWPALRKMWRAVQLNPLAPGPWKQMVRVVTGL